MAHIGGIRATVKVVAILDESCLRVGDVGTVLFKFMYGVEVLESGHKIMLREGTTKAVGYVSHVWPNKGGLCDEKVIEEFLVK